MVEEDGVEAELADVAARGGDGAEGGEEEGGEREGERPHHLHQPHGQQQRQPRPIRVQALVDNAYSLALKDDGTAAILEGRRVGASK